MKQKPKFLTSPCGCVGGLQNLATMLNRSGQTPDPSERRWTRAYTRIQLQLQQQQQQQQQVVQTTDAPASEVVQPVDDGGRSVAPDSPATNDLQPQQDLQVTSDARLGYCSVLGGG